MKRDSLNFKIIVASLNTFCDMYKDIHIIWPVAIKLGLSKIYSISPIILYCSQKVKIFKHFAYNN